MLDHTTMLCVIFIMSAWCTANHNLSRPLLHTFLPSLLESEVPQIHTACSDGSMHSQGACLSLKPFWCRLCCSLRHRLHRSIHPCSARVPNKRAVVPSICKGLSLAGHQNSWQPL